MEFGNKRADSRGVSEASLVGKCISLDIHGSNNLIISITFLEHGPKQTIEYNNLHSAPPPGGESGRNARTGGEWI